MIGYRIYVDMSKKRKDGVAPVFLIFESDGKRAKVNTGLLSSVKFTGREFPKEEPSYKIKTSALTMKLSAVDHALLVNESKPFDDVIDAVRACLDTKQKKQKTFCDYCMMYASTQENKSTRDYYEYTARKVEEFDKGVTLAKMTPNWLKEFEAYHLKTLTVNGLAIHMRNIRAVFNYAIDNEWTECYPFRKFKIKQEKTVPNNITLEELRTFRDYPLDGDWRKIYRDLFMLSFYLCGINPGDLLCLPPDALKGGHITYKRLKTGKMYCIPVYDEAMEIIERYKGKEWLLSPRDGGRDYHGFAQRWNKALKKIGDVGAAAMGKCGYVRKIVYKPLVKGMTIYSARYTFASIGAELDIPRETIALCLGHSWADVTSHYIAYGQKKIDDAVRKIIDYVNGEGE